MNRAGKSSFEHPAAPERQRARGAPGFLLALALVGLLAAGCASVPPPEVDTKSTADVLTAHVGFLSNPNLKGRRPGTRGSRLAREYIEGRFKAFGLVPWAQEKAYGLSFGHGENVVGMLPGSDPQLTREIVLLSAHYDHLGKDKAGRICPGAVDNASGVAVLLETARWMSSPGHCPKRTVAFAAFDCEEEMLFGSFAFTCRQDVSNASMVATVNLDMLGRDLLDVVRNTVFVAGTESYPTLRQDVSRLGADAGIRVLPIGADFIGPTSDQAAFESRDVPCLFFSCGICRDYHRATDTADKLDYAALERSARVVRETVAELANDAAPARAPAASPGDREELRTVNSVLSEINRGAEAAGIRPQDRDKLKKLETTAANLLAGGRYDREARERFVLDAIGTLGPYVLPFDRGAKEADAGPQPEAAMFMQYLAHFYLNYHREIMDGYRELVAQVLKYRPGLIRGMPRFEHEIYDIPDADISLCVRSNGTYVLHVLITPLVLKAEVTTSKWLVNSFRAEVVGTIDNIDGEGTREQMADLCLLRFRAEQTNSLHAEKLRKVLRAVNGTEPRGTYAELLAERLERGGFKDETEWIVSDLTSGNPALALAAIAAVKEDSDPRLHAAARRLVLERHLRSDVRAAALEVAPKNADRDTLLAWCAVLDDSSPAYTTEYTPLFAPDYPFADRAVIRTVAPLLESEFKHSPAASKTIGALARDSLKKATRKDFGSDARRWRNWVEAHAS